MSSEEAVVPYDELDPPVVELVRVLNEFGSISTIGSCGGHEDGEEGGIHAAAYEWWVTFQLEPADHEAESSVPSSEGWLDLEYLAYLLNTGGLRVGGKRDVQLVPYAPAPHLNVPGRMLRFSIVGFRGGVVGGLDGIEADELAEAIRRDLAEFYTSS
jgi:hypothetical protein